MKRELLLAAAVSLLCGGIAVAERPVSAGAPRLLAKADVGLLAPVWSPDGSQIAMTGDNYMGIYVSSADGSGLRQVSSAPGAGYKMTWTGEQEITSTPYTMENNRRMTRVERVDVASGTASVVAAAARDFKPSRALRRTAGVLDVMVDDPAGATSRIASLSAFAGKMVINPVLSPDGTKIAFQIAGKGLMVCRADGSDLRTLGRASHPSWLPDSRHLVAARIQDDGDRFTSSELYCIDTDTRAEMCLTTGTDAIPVTLAVSPDGRHVAFDNDADGAIYVIDLNY